MTRIVFIDTETGGLDPQTHSLLSVGLVIWEDGQVLDSAEFKIEHEVYHVTKKAMEVNGIDIKTHKGFGPLMVTDMIKTFLDKYKVEDNPLVVGGHNVDFDISFLKAFLGDHFSGMFSHRKIDTATLLRTFSYAGVIPLDIASLDSAISYVGIQCPNRHSALDDAIATAMIFTWFYEFLKPHGDWGG